MPQIRHSTDSTILIDSCNEVPPGFAAWVKLADKIQNEILLRVSNLLEENELFLAIEVYEEIYGETPPTTWH